MTSGEAIFEKYKRGNFDGDYLFISPQEWQEIKDTYPVDVVKERLAEVCMTWPIPYADISEEDAYDDYMKLKGIRWNEYLKEGVWFPRKAA
jgi:hypothetical protein